MTLSPRWAGATLGLASALLFGMGTPIAKILLVSFNPWMLAGILYLGAGIGLSGWQLIRKAAHRVNPEAPLRKADIGWLAGAVISGGIIGPVLLMLGLTLTQGSMAALLLNLESVATLLIAWIVFRENADSRILIGAAAIVLGAIVLSWKGEAGGGQVGALAIAGACMAWGVDNNLTRRISSADPVQITVIKGLAAGSGNLLLAFAMGAHLPRWLVVTEGSILGVFSYGLSLVLFVLALRYVGAARTGAYFSTAPFIGAVAGIFLLSEPLTLQFLAAAGLMSIGVFLHVSERHEHEHVHDALEHEHAHIHDEHHQHRHGPDDPPAEPHSHWHRHEPLRHSHVHFPDLHHRHGHGSRETGRSLSPE